MTIEFLFDFWDTNTEPRGCGTCPRMFQRRSTSGKSTMRRRSACSCCSDSRCGVTFKRSTSSANWSKKGRSWRRSSRSSSFWRCRSKTSIWISSSSSHSSSARSRSNTFSRPRAVRSVFIHSSFILIPSTWKEAIFFGGFSYFSWLIKDHLSEEANQHLTIKV